MPSSATSFVCWASATYLGFDRLFADLTIAQILAVLVCLVGLLFLYVAWISARIREREWALSAGERLGCSGLLDARNLQEGAEISIHTVDKLGGATFDARIGAVRKGTIEVWVDCDGANPGVKSS